jgi:hypothetical protein
MFNDKLRLEGKMGGSWLIQRLLLPRVFKLPGPELKDNPFSFGGGYKNGGLSDEAMGFIRKIWSFDYMGSAEFEFGSVPAALQFLAEQASKDNLVAGQIELNQDEIVYFLCPKSYEDDVKIRIADLRKDEYKLRLKEYCGLASYFTEKGDYAKNYGGWLELDNGFMFFVSKNMFEKTCALFGVKI